MIALLIAFNGLSNIVLHFSPEVKLFIERHCKDWDEALANMKQTLSVKSAAPLHQACGVFLHFMSKLETALPSGEFKVAAPRLRAAFLVGGMDIELWAAASSSVPPGDVKSIGAFRLGGLQKS